MKPQGTLTIASLALVTGLSGALVTPSAQAWEGIPTPK